MLDLSKILWSFAYFILAFTVFSVLAANDRVEQRLGQWFINSTSGFYEWSLPQASINIEHDRNPILYDPSKVWISPIGKEQLQSAIQEARMKGTSLEIENDASLQFKVSTFPTTALIFLLSLILATPISLRPKIKALLIGLFAFMLYFYFFMYISLLTHISVSRIGIYELEGFSSKSVRFLNRTFCNFGFSLTFAILVWAATAINFNALFKQFNTALQGGKNSGTLKTKTRKKKSKTHKKKSSN
ncbi:MAG: hypothetical protein KJP00_05605 [Bacteroidia bacterium]|nr:hypothetical protein [Bacteroidia bacterium]